MELSKDKIDIEPDLRKMILIEIIFPMVLLILGIDHGLMQVLYRAGMIRRSQFLGLTYFQGLTLHGVVNAIVFTTFFAVAFARLGALPPGEARLRVRPAAIHRRRSLLISVRWSRAASARSRAVPGGSARLRKHLLEQEGGGSRGNHGVPPCY